MKKIRIDGVEYDVVGKDVVVQNVTYRVRLLAAEFDASDLDLGDVQVTIRYQDTDVARAISFVFRCYPIDAITAPRTVSVTDAQTVVDFGANSARMDLTDLFPPEPFNTVPLNPYFTQLQVRESVLHLRSTARLAGGPSLIVDLAYERGETNVLYNGANTFNALLAGVPARLTALTTNGAYTSCIVEPVLDGADPVPAGSSHVYVYTTQALGYYLMRITSRYRDNDGRIVHELLPIRRAAPPWAVILPLGDATVLYVVPFAIKQLYDVGQGGPYSILSKPAAPHPAWTSLQDAVPPARTPKLVLVAEAPSREPWTGAPATQAVGTGALTAESLRPLPFPTADARFPRSQPFLHDAEPPDAHTYTFFADAAVSGDGVVLSSPRLAPAWCSPGGALELFYPDDSLPVTVARGLGDTDGVMDVAASAFASPRRFGGAFYRGPLQAFSKVTPLASDAWLVAVRVASDRTVALPFAARQLLIDGVAYDPGSATLTPGPAVALALGDLQEVYDAVLQLPATVGAQVSPPYETVTVPAQYLAGGAGPRYRSLTVTGSDGYARHLAIPDSGAVRYVVAAVPAAGTPTTRSAKMHLDGVAKAAGVCVLLPADRTLAGSLTGYFRYAGSDADRTLLTAGQAYASPTDRAVLTLADNTARRLISCVATPSQPGTVTLAPGTGAQMSEGFDAAMLEGAALSGATLSGDVLTYTATAGTAALLAAGAAPGSALFTLVGKARMKVRATRLSSVAALTFAAVTGTVPVSASAASPLVASLALLPTQPASALLDNAGLPVPLYDQVDALPFAATTTVSSLTATPADTDAAGYATLLLKLGHRGRSWLETSVSVSGGTAALTAAAPDPRAGCVVVTAVGGAVYAAALAPGARTFPCAAGATSAAPALLIHPRRGC